VLFLILFLACGDDNNKEQVEASCTEQCEDEQCIELCEFDKRCKKEIDPTSYVIVLGMCGPSPESCQGELERAHQQGLDLSAYCDEKNCLANTDDVPYPHCWGTWLE